MRLDFFYRKTPKIEQLLQDLEVLKKVIDFLPQLHHLEENLRRKSLLKSSLFSARIEGNKLKIEDVNYATSHTQDLAKIEVFNILRALRWIYSQKSLQKLTDKFILRLHQFVLNGISPEEGRWRTQPSAIFNQAGVAVYLSPPADEVPSLIKKLIAQTNASKEPGPISAAIFHFAFEKIHPFLDGNGRVGRLSSTFILKKSRFDFRGLASFEEHLEKSRQRYYDLLAEPKKEITEFVEFFLEALKIQAEAAIENLKETKTETAEDSLLPRRQEILAIIKDHQIVSFDFLKRRFSQIPASTLHYDLRQLLKGGFLRKLGITRGVRYSPSR